MSPDKLLLYAVILLTVVVTGGVILLLKMILGPYVTGKPSKLPKSERIVIILIIGFLVTFFTFTIGGYFRSRQIFHRAEERNAKMQAILESLPPDGIQKAAFYPSILIANKRNYPTDLTHEECVKLAALLKGIKRTEMRGRGRYERFGYIHLDAGAAGKFEIAIGSKDTAGGQVLGSVQIPDHSPMDFDAADLWNWLKER